MDVVRQVRPGDLDAVLALAASAGHGLTSLPKDPDLLRDRVLAACEGFSRRSRQPSGDPYLFVLEDGRNGEVVGTSGIVSKVGGFEPFYTFRVDTRVYQSRMLGVRREVDCLHLLAEHSGPCEIGSLYLDPNHRERGSGRLLSLSRFLFMAENPARFDPFVIAEMRGVVDEHGRCPFWESVGRHFFDVEFPEADRLSAQDKSFISELMPEYPVYVPLLTREAQSVLGQVHPRTRPALRMLEDEGFQPMGWVDVFDGGPVIGCRLREVRCVRESRAVSVAAVASRVDGGSGVVAACYAPEYRSVLTSVELRADDTVVLAFEAARALGVCAGDRLRVAPPRPQPASDAQ